MRAVEWDNFVNGPFCGKVLAELRAPVIKVEPPLAAAFALSGLMSMAGYQEDEPLVSELQSPGATPCLPSKPPWRWPRRRRPGDLESPFFHHLQPKSEAGLRLPPLRRVQHLTHLLTYRGKRERLCEERSASVRCPVLRGGIVGVAGCEKHLDSWMYVPEAVA